MANAIEIALNLQDHMTSGLSAAEGKLSGFTASLGGIIGIATAAGAALSGMAIKLSEEVEQLDNLSASTGVSTRNLQVLQFAFKQGGVDAGALSQGLNFLNRAIASGDPSLRRLGVTSRDTFTAFMEAARGIQSVGDSSERAKLMFDVFGRGGAQLSPILNRLAGDFSGVARAATDSGNVLSEAQIKRLEDLDAAFDNLAASIGGMAKEMAVAVAGPMVAFFNMLNSLSTGPSEKAVRTWEDFFLRMKKAGGEMFSGHGPQHGSGPMVDPAALAEAAKEAAALAQARRDAMGGLSSTNLAPQNRTKPPGIGLAGLADTGIIEQAERAHEHAQKLAEQMTRTFEDMGRNIQFSLMSVFMNITNKSQAFGSAMANIFRGVRDAVLQAIFEIVSAQITAAFLKLLGVVLTSFGFAGAGAAVTAVGSKIAGGNVLSGAPVAPMAAMGGGGGNQFVIQTFNAKDTLSQLVSGTGSFRRANDRLSEVGAAS